MRRFAILLVFVILASGCVSNPNIGSGDVTGDPGTGDDDPISSQGPESGTDQVPGTTQETGQIVGSAPTIPTVAETIALCDSLCFVDSDAYCAEQRSIELNGIEVTGTCRAFSKTGNVPGFHRCQGFCQSYSKSGTICYVDGVADSNCDGNI